MLKLNVYSKEGKIVGEEVLPSEVFELEPHDEAIYEAIKMYQANQRQGNASTKTRGLVRGGGRKPWKQKHTGRARAGSRRSPIWVGGGVVFGPRPRDYHYRMPRKKLKVALLSAVAHKAKDGGILLLNELDFSEPKTKPFSAMLQALGLASAKNALFAPMTVDKNVCLAGRNIKSVSLKAAEDINTFDVARASVLVFPLTGLEAFVKRTK
jgi:large subunit ribosomal protein L4